MGELGELGELGNAAAYPNAEAAPPGKRPRHRLAAEELGRRDAAKTLSVTRLVILPTSLPGRVIYDNRSP